MKKTLLDKIVDRWDRLSELERRQLVQRFSTELTLLNEVLDAMKDGVIIFDHSGVATLVNRAAAHIYGREAGDLLEMSFETLVGHTCTWAELSSSGYSITRDLQVHYPKSRHYQFFMTPLGTVQEEDEQRAYLLVIEDDTEKIMEGELEAEAEQMNLLSFLASGVAHELGNPVNSLGLNLQLMQRKLRKLPDDEGMTDLLSSSLAEVKRLDALIRQFLQSMRPSKLKLSKVEINDVINRVLEQLQPEIAAREIIIHQEFSEKLPLLDADEGQLFQVFYNLIRNAYQSIADSEGGVHIRTSFTDADVIVQVSDTGCGISHEMMGSLYEPFRSTKKSGNGLGLLIVRRIVKEHGGSLGIASREGEGTTVSVTLPRAERMIRLLPS